MVAFTVGLSFVLVGSCRFLETPLYLEMSSYLEIVLLAKVGSVLGATVVLILRLAASLNGARPDQSWKLISRCVST